MRRNLKVILALTLLATSACGDFGRKKKTNRIEAPLTTETKDEPIVIIKDPVVTDPVVTTPPVVVEKPVVVVVEPNVEFDFLTRASGKWTSDCYPNQADKSSWQSGVIISHDEIVLQSIWYAPQNTDCHGQPFNTEGNPIVTKIESIKAKPDSWFFTKIICPVGADKTRCNDAKFVMIQLYGTKLFIRDVKDENDEGSWMSYPNKI